MAIAKQLAEALKGIEEFEGDSEMILNDAAIYLGPTHNAQGPLAALRKYYIEESE